MTKLFLEARRLHALGFAIIWLHPKSKRPVGTKWTSGPRKTWAELSVTYRPGMNVGVRTGEASKIRSGETWGYLACIDVDVKDPSYRPEAEAELKGLLGPHVCPEVRSGSGNGSRHLYCITAKPFKMSTVAKSDVTFIDAKGKKHRKWEICVYSTGRQMVLPPSTHPDTGKNYEWARPLAASSDLPVMDFDEWSEKEDETPFIPVETFGAKTPAVPKPTNFRFQVAPVELSWLPISDEVREGILTGTGVTDRSGYLLRASSALLSAGLTQDEVLTVLTDSSTFLGKCAYEHAQTKDRVKAAEWLFRYTFKKVQAEREPSVFAKAPLPARMLTKDEALKDEAFFEEERHWKQDLIRTGNGDGPPAKLIENVVLILKNAVAPDVVKRDTFCYRDTYGCDTPWGAKKDALVTDDDVACILYWLSKNYRFEPSNQTVERALVVIATDNAYDPVKNLLSEIPPWDGQARLNGWLRRHFEAEGDPEYLAQVFRKWMVAMVLRVYEPGAKFDWMPIFEGAQGIGKSSFGRLLVGDRYFLDWLPNLNDKDSALALQGMWSVELGELSQFRKTELENIKAFITRTVDKMRPPYGKRLIESPRRCVFFGTTNRKTYLTDETGNRRFKPVVVGRLDFDALRRDRLQLFAEAKALYDQKKETEITLDLTGLARTFEAEIHSEKMVEDDSHAMEEAMEIFVEKVGAKTIEFDLSKFRLFDLFEGGGPLQKWKPENRNFQFAAKMLRRLGATDRKIRGVKHWRLGVLEEKSEPPTHPLKANDLEELTFI